MSLIHQSRREMATGWIRSLQCKSKALDDVVFTNRRPRRSHSDRKTHHHHDSPLSQSSSCRNSVQNLKDIVETTKPKKPKPKKPTKPRKPEPGPNQMHSIRATESVFPALKELPAGHPSRNVVEIIFHTSWGDKSFAGRVEMVFKVQNLTRTVTRFEEYREAVKSRASCMVNSEINEDHARCVADGNEVMRFYCLGASACVTGGGAWDFKGGIAASMYSGSGVAHEKAGSGRGPRAMMVCRVIAGRVCKKLRVDSVVEGGYDSVGGENGELFVLDSRALLPCFLIIYEL